MKYLREKIKAGVINLSTISTEQLIQMSQEAETEDERNLIGCEIMYR